MTLRGFADLFLAENLRFLARGLGVTLYIALWSIGLSFAGGLVLGVLRHTGDHHPGRVVAQWLGRASAIYIETIRNLPMLLIIMVMRFWSGLPPVWAGIAGMSVFTSAVMAEIIRGGIGSVERGQWEAAYSQGFSYAATLRYVVLPQALRRMIPPIVSQFITLVKDTAFVGMVGVVELTQSGVVIFSRYINPMETFLFVAVVYFVVNYFLSIVARSLEHRLAQRSF